MRASALEGDDSLIFSKQISHNVKQPQSESLLDEKYLPASLIARHLLPDALDAPYEAISGALDKLRYLDSGVRKKPRRLRTNKLSSSSSIIVHKPSRGRLPRRAWSPFIQADPPGSAEPKDIDMGQATRIASIRIDPVPPRRARARFRIEVAHVRSAIPSHSLPLAFFHSRNMVRHMESVDMA